MKANILKVAFAALLILGMGASSAMALDGGGVNPVAHNFANGQADVTVVTPINIENDRPLLFGIATQNDSLVVAATASANTNNSVLTDQGNVQSAQFTVTGGALQAFTAQYPPVAGITMVNLGVGSDLVSNAFINCDTGGAFANKGQIGQPTATIYCGGTLDIDAADTAGDYQGVFTVTVNYP